MVQNYVVVNLLMGFLFFSGVFVLLVIKKEMFFEFFFDVIQVQVFYLGVSFVEVEEGVVICIEEWFIGFEDVGCIIFIVFEGVGIIELELLLGVDFEVVFEVVKNEIDCIEIFLVEIEKLVISEVLCCNWVIDVVVFGDVLEKVFKVVVEWVCEDLCGQFGIIQVEFVGIWLDEILIEVLEKILWCYGFIFGQVVNVV